MHLRRSLPVAALLAAIPGLSCAHRPASAASPEYAATPTGSASLAAAISDSVHVALDRALADSAFPGAFAIVGNHAGVYAEYGVGRLDWAPDSPRPDEHSMYDLASLTKVIGMTTAMEQLVQEGKVDLDAPFQRYFPNWTGPNKEKVTIRNLITHTSGLPAFKAYDLITTDADSMAKLMFATPLDTLPGVRMVYSDIGAWLLGQLVGKVSGEPLDVYLQHHVFGPLKMTETMYNPPASLYPRIAPTEIDPKRGGKVHGKVHDERAYYLGGVSAHAGLFSSGHDLARFARMYLNGGQLDGVRIVNTATIEEFIQRQVQDRALGWQKPTGGNSAGHLMTEQAFGHTGFTGTSIWIDPPRDVFIILLSNRVDPTRANLRIGRERVRLADAVMSTVIAAGVPGAPALSSTSSPKR